MSFDMQTDARARRVAKDLKNIAAEFGVKLRITQAQQAVAHLYGYKTWNALLSAIGIGAGLEDHELTEEALNERKRGQLSALKDAGIPASLAQDILNRLAPTGRAEAALPRVALIQSHNDYHPMRLLWTLGIGCHPDPISTYDDIDYAYVEWAKRRTLMPLDRNVLSEFERNGLETMAWCAEKIRDDTHFVVDAVAIAEDASKRDVLTETWRPEFSDGKNETLYFHFGCHRFPSPFHGLGVEGCYVDIEVARSQEHAPREVEFIFVVSPDVASQETGYLMDGSTFEMELRENIRLVNVYFSPFQGQTVGKCLQTTGLGDEHLDAYLDAWRPYLPPLLNAGWNCFKAWKSGKLRLHDALSVEEDPEMRRRFERARTERKRMAVAAEIALESDQFLVRFIDREPPSGDVYSEVATAPYPRSDSGSSSYDQDYVQSVIEDALEVCSPGGLLWHAGKAVGLAEAALDSAGLGDADLSSEKHPAAHQYLVASCLLLNALWEHDKKEDALLLAETIQRRLSIDSIGLFPALARIYVEHNDETRARAAVAKYADAKTSNALVAWSIALVDAKFGPAKQAKASLAHAHSLNASAAAELLQIDELPWLWFERDEEVPAGAEEEDEADHIACLHGSAWRTVDGYRKILESVDRFADGVSKHVSMKDYRRKIAALSGQQDYRRDAALARAGKALDMAWDETTALLQKVELARQALAISPLCVGGYIMLASYANLSPDEKLLCWENGVIAGAKVLGERYFADEVGYFWDDLVTRDYMRARLGLALELWERGRRSDAIGHLEELLRLNPRDNQGNRYILLPWLIQMDRDAEVEAFLNEWSKGHESAILHDAMLMWTKTLVAFRRDPASATKPLVAAVKCNAFVPGYLFGNECVDRHSSKYSSPGEPSEASEYARLALEAWSNEARSWVDVTLAALGMNPVASDPRRTYFRH